jgi:hypothetical protein
VQIILQVEAEAVPEVLVIMAVLEYPVTAV